MSDRNEIVSRVTAALEGKPAPVAIRNARKVDARGERRGYWVVSDAAGVIVAAGTGEGAFEHCCRTVGLDPADRNAVIDAEGRILTPGYVDIHAHGAWEKSFDDGPDGIDVARAGHAVHGTTRQVLSLITNPVDVICRNIRTVRATMESGRQITIAPELPLGISAIRQFAAAGVVPAVGHCDADYETAKAGFDAGAGIMTHMFNAMNGLHHREPGPIPAAVEDPRVTIELINDGFHVQDPMVSLSFRFAPHRTAFVTDAMAATDCPDGAYKLGALDVNVVGGHARLVSNGAIAGSTLLLEVAVRRAVCELGFSPVDAVEAATLTPAKAFGFDRPNPVTGAPIGLIAPGFAADFNLADPADWTVEQVWCAGRKLK